MLGETTGCSAGEPASARTHFNSIFFKRSRFAGISFGCVQRNLTVLQKDLNIRLFGSWLINVSVRWLDFKKKSRISPGSYVCNWKSSNMRYISFRILSSGRLPSGRTVSQSRMTSRISSFSRMYWWKCLSSRCLTASRRSFCFSIAGFCRRFKFRSASAAFFIFVHMLVKICFARSSSSAEYCSFFSPPRLDSKACAPRVLV